MSATPSASTWCASTITGALDLLRRPHEPAPDNAHDTYVYAVALNFGRRHCRGRRRSSRQPTISALPISEVLTAFVSIARDKGNFAAALRYARELLTLDPGNTPLQALVSELEKKSRP